MKENLQKFTSKVSNIDWSRYELFTQSGKSLHDKELDNLMDEPIAYLVDLQRIAQTSKSINGIIVNKDDVEKLKLLHSKLNSWVGRFHNRLDALRAK